MKDHYLVRKRKGGAVASKKAVAYRQVFYSTYSHTATFRDSKSLEMLKSAAYAAQADAPLIPKDK